MSDEKQQDVIAPAQSSTESIDIGKVDLENDGEVFKRGEGIEDFRTVSWVHTSMIFLKVIFATGVLTIPSAMYTLGAFPGAINVLGWQALNTWCALVLGNFRNNHPGCHSIADMGQLVGGRVVKEISGMLFLVAFIIVAASGMVGVSTALNALSNHSLCTNYFSIVAAIMIAVCASVRKFEKIAWITWAGFASVFIAVFIVVVGVTTRDRPAAAPQSGPYEFGYHVIAHPTFAAGITAASTIFCSGAGTSAFLPVMSEMRNPREYSKAVNWCMGIVTAAYLSFSLVVYKWCGKWVASPSLGSAGPMVKKIAYGIGLIGLCVSGALYVHVSAKYVFVRILRNSKHLQANSAVHWGTWFGCVAAMSITSFLIASGVPIFNYLLSLAGSVAFAPLALGLPGWLWIYDHADYWKGTLWQKTMYMLHVVLIFISAFLTIGGTYGVIVQILNAYKDGLIDSAFSCADNSNSS
ncbi:hypothetical protein HBI56_170360 [Parastagonospora nodorum]|uniref:Amino acid transporter transmembrane domain-containing protein n=1 Tax=Phaeosphaeria nodorum (strain SN15 / ATCC MYA-4574 / FGSC 10173) TaxID=321614 RepID=A0A7U2I724_PHANO|nr:hypothetical protein HBH56_245100 [Parastagonospora nodorum]QRD01908.1 hypothetical protein JI435_439880 [Parastagonospora nodorum SN15]KAH3935876.1 hypothetical protein HBH54_034170 [Parastagonospora nodorum]KAH3938697.1 hypothetical protein HBH53_247300 [Parastagonospora nodorum]KAH3964154.1 hypothetical protein HBH51_160020 [Parastagonospora nodorum]